MTGPVQRLAVGPGDAALPGRGEGVPAAPVRIGPQHLHRVGAAPGPGRVAAPGTARRLRSGARAGHASAAAGCGSAGRGPPTAPGTPSPRRRRPGRGWRSVRHAMAAGDRRRHPAGRAAHRRRESSVVPATVAQVDPAHDRPRPAPGGRGGAARRASGGVIRGCAPAYPAGIRRQPPRSPPPRSRCSCRLNRNRSRCERHSRPRTITPRLAASASTRDTSVPGPSSRSSGSPRQSVNSSRSPASIARTAASSSAKYAAPCSNGRTWFPVVHAAPSGCRESSLVAELPRSAGGEEPLSTPASLARMRGRASGARDPKGVTESEPRVMSVSLTARTCHNNGDHLTSRTGRPDIGPGDIPTANWSYPDLVGERCAAGNPGAGCLATARGRESLLAGAVKGKNSSCTGHASADPAMRAAGSAGCPRLRMRPVCAAAGARPAASCRRRPGC